MSTSVLRGSYKRAEGVIKVKTCLSRSVCKSSEKRTLVQIVDLGSDPRKHKLESRKSKIEERKRARKEKKSKRKRKTGKVHS